VSMAKKKKKITFNKIAFNYYRLIALGYNRKASFSYSPGVTLKRERKSKASDIPSEKQSIITTDT